MSTLEEELLSKIHHFNGYMNRSHTKKRNFELGRGQGRLLRYLSKEDGIQQQELGEKLSIQPGSLSELIKKVEVKDYIRREADENDKRRQLIYITDLGLQVADDMLVARKEASHEIFSPLTEEEQKELARLLDKLMVNNKKYNKPLKNE